MCQLWPGIGEAERLAVLDDVREDHHLRYAGLLVAVGDVDLELAEARGEIPQLPGGEVLARKAQDAVLAERAHRELERFVRQRLR